MADARFASLTKDPRFIKPKRVAQKVQVDPRFESVFAEKEKTTDKYGRRKDAAAKETAELRKFYKIDSSSKGNNKAEEALKVARGEILLSSSDEDDEDTSDGLADDASIGSDDERSLDGEVALGNESDFSVDLDEEALPGAYNSDEELQEITTCRLAAVNLDWDHIRAADLFKIFTSALTTMANKKSKVTRVTVLPSDFGKSRMANEELNGPPKEIFAPGEDESADEIDEKAIIKAATTDKGSEFNERQLRKYQLERLRYYYAVVEFDSVKSARHAFEEIQGTEFERSANVFELRCIPDDMTFDLNDARDTATTDQANYRAPDYVTDALRHSKVKLTWDQDDPQRSRLTRTDTTKLSKKQVDDMDADFATYLASASSDEGDSSANEDPVDSKKERMRKLFGLGDGKSTSTSAKPSGDMEITFKPALAEDAEDDESEKDETTLQTYKRKEKERKQRKKVDQTQEDPKGKGKATQATFDDDFFEQEVDFESAFNAPPSDSEDAITATKESEPAPFNKKLSKAEKKARKEAEAKQAAELSLLVDGEAERHFDMADIVRAEKEDAKGNSRAARRKKSKKSATGPDAVAPTADKFEMDVNDNRFDVLAQDHRFAIDPSNPRYQKTKNMEKLLQETRKKRDGANLTEQSEIKTQGEAAQSAKKDDLDQLVQSIKRRTKDADSKKSRKKKRTE